LAPIILQHEGGYIDNPNDRGGKTNKGIAWETWVAYAQKDLGILPTVENLKMLTDEDATLIYYRRYWIPSGMDDVYDTRLALMVYDWTITSHFAPREIQRLLNLKYAANITIDNMLGPGTIQALNRAESTILHDVAETRRRYYRALAADDPKNETFIHGWLARVDDCMQRAL
jgi:lysozyme family protein